jgi:hypothetical protein
MLTLLMVTDVIGLPMLTLLLVTNNVSGTTPTPPMVPDNPLMTTSLYNLNYIFATVLSAPLSFPRLLFFASVGNLCQSISNNSMLTLLSVTNCIGSPMPRVASATSVLVLYRYRLSITFSTTEGPRLN